jgi:hypothetical protein
LSFHEILIPILSVALPLLSLFIGKKFERREKQESKIKERFAIVEERLDMAELRIARLSGILNGRS